MMALDSGARDLAQSRDLALAFTAFLFHDFLCAASFFLETTLNHM